jgi:hypothetical protein
MTLGALSDVHGGAHVVPVWPVPFFTSSAQRAFLDTDAVSHG